VQHGQTILSLSNDSAPFVRRVCRRDEVDVVKGEELARGFGQYEMADVDGVEGAAEQTGYRYGARQAHRFHSKTFTSDPEF
jgi:hypothetical protein